MRELETLSNDSRVWTLAQIAADPSQLHIVLPAAPSARVAAEQSETHDGSESIPLQPAQSPPPHMNGSLALSLVCVYEKAEGMHDVRYFTLQYTELDRVYHFWHAWPLKCASECTDMTLARVFDVLRRYRWEAPFGHETAHMWELVSITDNP